MRFWVRHHDTIGHGSGSSFWADTVVYADSPEEAAAQMEHLCEKHTIGKNPLKVLVYALPDEYETFFIKPSVSVERG